ncbi:MAG TPA: response regulator [Blastocatellia bacterium]|nr:response regulator [Blastocatellia bacterium]
MPKKVLVVEDHPDAREMLSLYLTSEGYAVVTAEDGQCGLQVAEAERPDIIITNLNMPNLDGLEMTKRIRLQPDFGNVPIIVLSAITTDEPDILINAGASLVKNKPVKLHELVDVIRDALSNISEAKPT